MFQSLPDIFLISVFRWVIYRQSGMLFRKVILSGKTAGIVGIFIIFGIIHLFHEGCGGIAQMQGDILKAGFPDEIL